MKSITIIIFLLIITIGFSMNIPVNNILYIYVKSKDQLFIKTIHNGAGSIYYVCNCYARKNALEFTFTDTNKNYLKDTIPANTYSMMEFAQIANETRANFKNLQLWHTKIYIIEAIDNHKYHYYQVQFYPIESDE